MFRLTLNIAGRVQGVGFRWFVYRTAQQIGVTGYVRNCPDGGVEVVADGPEEWLDQLEALCRKGPRSARVDRVESGRQPLTGQNFSTFEIR